MWESINSSGVTSWPLTFSDSILTVLGRTVSIFQLEIHDEPLRKLKNQTINCLLKMWMHVHSREIEKKEIKPYVYKKR